MMNTQTQTDMFEDRTPDGEPDGWTVLAFPLREVR
jgi:hypothetical protein